MNIIKTLYNNYIFERIFHTTAYSLKKELKSCESVLDLGCGPDSPIQHCNNLKYTVGIEAYKPYLKTSKRKKIHNKYINKNLSDLKFTENSFDAVIMIEVLEHLPKETGKLIIKNAGKWAKKKVIITTPNGFIKQEEIDGNPLQKHLSVWTVSDMNKLGFKSKGLAGFKFLRQEKDENTMGDNILVSIKYKPKIFWFIIATLSQTFIYYIPNLAFELFCVKNKNEK